MRLAVLALFVIACASASQGPTAVVRLAAPAAWSEQDLAHVRRGAEVWQVLGFNVELETSPNLPECRNDWYRLEPPQTRCTITIGLVRAEAEHMDGLDAYANRDTDEVVIDSRFTGWDLTAIVAHELGHILLNSGHLSAGELGVMAPRGSRWELTDADHALACRAINRGCP